MLSKEDFAVMKALTKRGIYLKDIAVELGVHPKTVSRALRRGGAGQGLRRRRGSKLRSTCDGGHRLPESANLVARSV